MKLVSQPTALLLAAAGGAAFVATGAASPSAAAPATVRLQPAAAATEGTPAPAGEPGGNGNGNGNGKGKGKGAAGAKSGLAGRGLHADFVVKGKTGAFVTAASQRGEVTAVSPTGITLKSEDGFTRSYVVGPDTKVTGAPAPAEISAVVTGAQVSLVAVKNADAFDARRISLRK